VLQLFLTDAAQRLQLLRSAVDVDDTPEILRQAHTLKGAAGNMGAQAMANTADDLWRHVHDDQRTAIREDLARMERDFARYRVAVVPWL
jgi:HPt (histidine-containing phosphotransfer) domain-containing protein